MNLILILFSSGDFLAASHEGSSPESPFLGRGRLGLEEDGSVSECC